MRNEKTPLESNSTRSVSYHHFGWAFPSSAKSWADESRPIALKTRFFDFPHRGEANSNPWNRIPRGRFHTTILGGAFASSANGRVDEGCPIAVKTRFCDFPHRGEANKHPWDRIPCGRFHATILGWLFQAVQTAGLRKVVHNAFKMRLFDFHNRGKANKHPWDRILRGRFYTTILGGLFQTLKKAVFTNVVQLRSKRVFSTFPIGAKRIKTHGIEFHQVGFIPPFWVGFS